MTTTIRHECPGCGDSVHLYGRADRRWDFERQDWIVGDMEDEVECTECDWSGPLADTMTPKHGAARDSELDDLRAFVELIGRMETEDEFNARTDDEGMSGDDAVMTLSALIASARAAIAKATEA